MPLNIVSAILSKKYFFEKYVIFCLVFNLEESPVRSEFSSHRWILQQFLPGVHWKPRHPISVYPKDGAS